MIDSKVVTIEITDYGDMASNSAEKKDVEDNLRESIDGHDSSNTIIKSFFETAFIGEKSDEDDGGEGEEGTSPGSPQPNPDLGLTARDKMVKETGSFILFLKSNVDKSKVTDIFFHFKKNGVVEFLRYPNGSLSVQLTDSERKAAVRYIDVE